MKFFLFISAFLCLAIVCHGQTHKIDNLKHLVYSSKNNRDKLKAILNLCNEYETLPKDTLWNYSLKAKALAAALNDTHSFSMAILAQANAYLRWDNIDSALALIEPELLKYKVSEPATKDIYFKLEQARIDCIGNGSDYKDAFSEVYSVLRRAENYKDSIVIAESMNTLGAWDYDMNFLSQSRGWFYKALSYTVNTPRFYPVCAIIYINLANNYCWIGKLDSATYCTDKAIILSEQIENLFYLSVSLQKQATIYIEKKEYKKAEQAILKSLLISQKIDGREPQQDKLIVLAAVYERSGQIDKAINVLNGGLSMGSTFKRNSPHSKKGANAKDLQKVFYYQELAKCYKLKGDSKNYAATLEKIIAGKDAFYEANSAEAIAELETKYEFQKKETTIARQKLALIQEKYFIYGLFGFLFLSGMVVWLIFKELRRKQQLKLIKIHEEEKYLSIKAVADAEDTERKRIAADLHDNLGAQLSFIKRNVNFIIDQPVGFSYADERKYLGYVNDTAQNAMVDLRETIWVLNNDEIDIQEFADKLKSYLRQQLLDKDKLSCDFQGNVSKGWKLSSGEVMHIFRIVQELVSNVIKHSDATHIYIKFNSQYPNTYQLEIMDNGKGFDLKCDYKDHYGLENIYQRSKEINAKLSIESDSENGTHVALNKGQNNSSELYSNTNVSNNFNS